MSQQTPLLSPRMRRLSLLTLAAVTLPALGLWVWNQRPAGDAPQRTLAAEESQPQPPDEHEYTNRLINETSPYLLQHAHNPVDWYPWGDEAFEKARREDKPIFLSVGYSTCYWCHVMEKESFEVAEVAELLNEHFIAIKVDREERPDVDEQYMLATQLLTQRGGWPNSVWLTPEGKPWMAGTYFPRPQFMQALEQLAEIWETRRDDVERQADQLVATIEQVGSGTGPQVNSKLTLATVNQAVDQLVERFDPRHGGFGGAPKFPPHGTLQLLMRQARDTGHEALGEPISKTLDAMWLGGMHDHIGGGFHRYSTDAEWLLPHFEKMLYDNAQLMRAYTEGYLLTDRQRYRNAVEDIFGWVQREMTAPVGAFYSAIDSGDVGKEGETYVWHIDEVMEVLGDEDGRLFAQVYNIEKHGNFVEEATRERPGTNIPHLDRPVRETAEARGEDPQALHDRLTAMRDKLLARRQTWAQPHKDDKVLTSWNGLMIDSLAYAGRQLDEPRYTEAAARAAGFILEHMMRDGTLLRTYRHEQAKQPGYLDDYAYFASGLIELHHATGDEHWLRQAEALAQKLLNEFEDEANGGFYFTTAQHDDLLLRSKGLSGGGNLPSANAMAAQVLMDLAQLTGDAAYLAAADRTLESLSGIMQQNPHGSEHLLVAAAQRLRIEDAAQASAEEPAAPSAPDTSPAVTASPDVRKRAEPVTVEAFVSRLAVRPGGSFEVAVAMDIDEGWHLYAENPEIDFLLPSTVAIEGDAFAAGQVNAPEPHRMQDPILKQQLNTYVGRVWFRVPVTIEQDAEPGAQTLAVTVKTQACDDSRCLPPQTTTLQLPIQIDPQAADTQRHPELFTVPRDGT